MTGERFSWFPCEQAKLLSALAEMKADQKLVYLIVILRIYDVGGPLRDGIEALAIRCGINKRRVLEALNALFKSGKLVREGDSIMNPYAVKVIAGRAALREERVRAGQEGGRRAAENRKQNQSTPPSKATAKSSELEIEKESLRPNGLKAAGGDLFDSESVDGHPLDPEADLYRRGKEVLGSTAGGMIKRLLAAKGNNVALARAAVEIAATKGDPRQYVGAMIRGPGAPPPSRGAVATTKRYMQQEMEERYGTPADAENGR